MTLLTTIQVGNIMKPTNQRGGIVLEELNITAKGSLQNRIYLNNDRLHSDYYSEKNFIQDNEYSWPGDFEGRTLLALVSLAKALHKQEFPEKLFLLAKEHVNQDKYFGKLFDGKVANEQQISGNSWYLRALVAIYEEYKDTFAYESICSIIDNFVVKLLPFYKKYPMESKYRDNTNKGEAIGALYTKTVNDWYLSTDTGCAFIALDGFTSAYSIYPNQELKQLIEFMIEKFMSIDKVGLRCQTHATLSASRGIMRFYEITQQDKYLDYVKGIFDLYLQDGMTCNYANYNWFLRPSWTEPCAIVDSLILAFSLFRETGEYRYAQVVNRIYANALRFAQRGNGGFGCDVCLDENENYLKPNQNFYEAFWCCTMRGAEGLLWCVENVVQSKGNTVTVVCAEDCNVVSKDGKTQFSLAVEKGRQNVLSLDIVEWKNGQKLKIYVPENYKDLEINGQQNVKEKGGFIELDNVACGKLCIRYSLPAVEEKLKKGKVAYFAGDFMLGEPVQGNVPDNEKFDTEKGALTFVEDMSKRTKSEGLSVRQRMIF